MKSQEIFEYAELRIKFGQTKTQTIYFNLYNSYNDLERMIISRVDRIITASEQERLNKRQIIGNVKWELGISKWDKKN